MHKWTTYEFMRPVQSIYQRDLVSKIDAVAGALIVLLYFLKAAPDLEESEAPDV